MVKNRDAIDKKKYRTDTISYTLVLLGLVFNVLYFTTLYKNNHNYYYNYKMGISVVYNLVFMLLVFFGAEEIKHYRRPYAVLLFIIGLLQIGRIFVFPRLAFEADRLSRESYNWIIVYLLASCALLVAGAITSFVNTTILKRYIAGKLQLPQSEEV
jgi:hypothetical protein